MSSLRGCCTYTQQALIPRWAFEEDWTFGGQCLNVTTMSSPGSALDIEEVTGKIHSLCFWLWIWIDSIFVDKGQGRSVWFVVLSGVPANETLKDVCSHQMKALLFCTLVSSVICNLTFGSSFWEADQGLYTGSLQNILLSITTVMKFLSNLAIEMALIFIQIKGKLRSSPVLHNNLTRDCFQWRII